MDSGSRTDIGGYLVPAGPHRVEELIRKSRFITTLDRAESRDDAMGVVDRIRAEFADATHHCWAFAAGPPGHSGRVGMSDAGEPHGTAGRPMLTALLNGHVGQVVAVGTRYYGGVKLGRGGLARAYSGGVVLALESLPVERLVPRIQVTVDLAHADVPHARRIFDRLAVRVLDERWGEGVRYDLSVPESQEDALTGELGQATSGRASVDVRR